MAFCPNIKAASSQTLASPICLMKSRMMPLPKDQYQVALNLALSSTSSIPDCKMTNASVATVTRRPTFRNASKNAAKTRPKFAEISWPYPYMKLVSKSLALQRVLSWKRPLKPHWQSNGHPQCTMMMTLSSRTTSFMLMSIFPMMPATMGKHSAPKRSKCREHHG